MNPFSHILSRLFRPRLHTGSDVSGPVDQPPPMITAGVDPQTGESWINIRANKPLNLADSSTEPARFDESGQADMVAGLGMTYEDHRLSTGNTPHQVAEDIYAWEDTPGADIAARACVAEYDMSHLRPITLIAHNYMEDGQIRTWFEMSAKKMPEPDTILTYPDGHTAPAMFHYAHEGQDLTRIARDNGFACKIIMAIDEEDMNTPFGKALENLSYSEADIQAWTPPSPGNDWKLVLKDDSEDGPRALFIRPLNNHREAAA